MGDVPGSRAEGRPRLPVARGPQPAASAVAQGPTPTLNPPPWGGLGPAFCDHPLPSGLSCLCSNQEGIP